MGLLLQRRLFEGIELPANRIKDPLQKPNLALPCRFNLCESRRRDDSKIHFAGSIAPGSQYFRNPKNQKQGDFAQPIITTDGEGYKKLKAFEITNNILDNLFFMWVN